MKYPTFLIGALYTQVTGESVVSGYAKISRYSLLVVGLGFLSVMFTVVSAVSMLGSGILIETFSLGVDILPVSIVLIIISTLSVRYFSFSTFQNFMKYVFLLLTILTLGILVFSLTQFQSCFVISDLFEFDFAKEDIFFIAALVGWMPAGLDLPMMHSQWVLENKSSNDEYDVVQDFNFGYLSTTILAIIFLLIGVIFFYGQDIEFSTSAVGFSKQLLDVYREVMGDYAGIPVGLTLFLAIFSSLIVVIDGFPRVLSEVIYEWKNLKAPQTSIHKYRSLCVWFQAFGAIALLFIFTSSLTQMVDFATTISFLLAPIFVYLNHKLISVGELISRGQKTKVFYWWSLLGVISFTTFTIFYIFF